MTQTENELLTTTIEKRCDEIFYYNALFVNNTGGLIPLVINDKRSQSILNEGLRFRWVGCLERFLVRAYMIPATIMPDPTIYKVTLFYSGVAYTQNLVYIPFTNSTIYPLNVSVFTVFQFLEMVNATLLAAYNAMVVGGYAPIAGDFAPFLVFDQETEKFSLITNTVTYTPGGSAPTVTIYFNYALNQLLGGTFDSEVEIGQSPRDVWIKSVDLRNNTRASGTYSGVSIASFEMYNTSLAIIPLTTIKRLIINSLQTPIKTQYYGTNISTTPSNLTLTTIEDFIFDPVGTRGEILYEPYTKRRFNFESDQPLDQMYFAVNYMDSNMNQYPVMVPTGGLSDFKFSFTKEYRDSTVKVLKQIQYEDRKDKKK